MDKPKIDNALGGDCEVKISSTAEDKLVVTLTLSSQNQQTLQSVTDLFSKGLKNNAKPVLTEQEARESGIILKTIKDVTDALNKTLRAKNIISEDVALHDFHPVSSISRH